MKLSQYLLGIGTGVSMVLLFSTLTGAEGAAPMIERLNPEVLHPPSGQSLIVISSAKRTAYFTANPLDANGQLVGGNDFEKQNEQIAKNIGIALDELGVDHRSILKLTAYIVDYDAAFHGPLIMKALAKNPPDYEYPATALVSVKGLARPDFLAEIEVTIGLE